MAQVRDRSRFGSGPYIRGLRRTDRWGSGFPYDLPAKPRAVLDGALEPVLEVHRPQSFLAPASNRIGGEALFVLDEPEAALSLTGELDEAGVGRRAYDDLDAVRFLRGFLDAPDRYLGAALGDD